MKPLISAMVAGLLVLGIDPGGGAEVSKDGNKVNLEVSKPSRLVLTGGGLGGGKGDGYRIRRPCWYEPFLSGKDMLRFQTDGRTQSRRILADEPSFRRHIAPFEAKENEEGLWWASTYNTADPAGAACWAGLQQFVFVPPNTTPASGITLEQLAEIARAAMTVPEHTIKLNPDAKSYVNLPTYVWLEGIGQPRRTVTASIPGFMSVTVVATLQEINIESGTTAERAETREEGCGATGRPYTKGAAFTCGVRYLRSSIDQPGEKYTMTVSTVWPVEVVDDVVDVTFGPVEVGSTREVPVGEIQSNVRP